MPPEFYVAKLLRDHGVSDHGILQIQNRQVVSSVQDRESIRNMLYWLAGYMQSHPPTPVKIPDRDR